MLPRPRTPIADFSFDWAQGHSGNGSLADPRPAVPIPQHLPPMFWAWTCSFSQAGRSSPGGPPPVALAPTATFETALPSEHGGLPALLLCPERLPLPPPRLPLFQEPYPCRHLLLACPALAAPPSAAARRARGRRCTHPPATMAGAVAPGSPWPAGAYYRTLWGADGHSRHTTTPPVGLCINSYTKVLC